MLLMEAHDGGTIAAHPSREALSWYNPLALYVALCVFLIMPGSYQPFWTMEGVVRGHYSSCKRIAGGCERKLTIQV